MFLQCCQDVFWGIVDFFIFNWDLWGVGGGKRG
jgi:hypothetical protein